MSLAVCVLDEIAPARPANDGWPNSARKRISVVCKKQVQEAKAFGMLGTKVSVLSC